MNLLSTLKTNWRDIVVGISLILICSIIADSIERWTLMDSGATWANNTVMAFRGLARFSGANLAGFMMLAVAWPTINRYSNLRFSHTWDNLPEHYKFFTLIVLSVAYLVSAALCFSV
jgi:hypothetical protein